MNIAIRFYFFMPLVIIFQSPQKIDLRPFLSTALSSSLLYVFPSIHRCSFPIALL